MSNKNSPRREQRYVSYVGTCDAHGKQLWPSKQRAKGEIRRHGWSGMRAYRCDAVEGCWHVGHQPKVVRDGQMSAREVYG